MNSYLFIIVLGFDIVTGAGAGAGAVGAVGVVGVVGIVKFVKFVIATVIIFSCCL